MPKVIWKLPNGSDLETDVDNGTTLMEAALDNDVPEIIGECGGCLSCATCHVFVDSEWFEKTGQPDEMEEAMLDVTDVAKQQYSRLSCQITMSDELDGLVVHVPS